MHHYIGIMLLMMTPLIHSATTSTCSSHNLTRAIQANNIKRVKELLREGIVVKSTDLGASRVYLDQCRRGLEIETIIWSEMPPQLIPLQKSFVLKRKVDLERAQIINKILSRSMIKNMREGF